MISYKAAGERADEGSRQSGKVMETGTGGPAGSGTDRIQTDGVRMWLHRRDAGSAWLTHDPCSTTTGHGKPVGEGGLRRYLMLPMYPVRLSLAPNPSVPFPNPRAVSIRSPALSHGARASGLLMSSPRQPEISAHRGASSSAPSNPLDPRNITLCRSPASCFPAPPSTPTPPAGCPCRATC